MADMMTFPDTVEEFMEQYKIVDTKGIYMSKGSELVPIFRMKQWFEHKPPAQPDRSLWFRIGEICVDESKGFISTGRAVEKIRELLREAERREE